MKMKNDLISRQAAIDAIRKIYDSVGILGEKWAVDKCQMAIKDLPPVQLSLESIVHPQILDDAEKRYLNGVIKPFRDNVKSISKGYNRLPDKEFIVIFFKDGEESTLPYFETGTMYKGMEQDKMYSLEELGMYADE